VIHTGPMIERGEGQPTPVAFYYARPMEPARHIIIITDAGTGGNSTLEFFRNRLGYRPFPLIEQEADPPTAASAAPFADLMLEVKAAFGRTMTRLPVVFGVSRQTLYNWLKGETPKGLHQDKLIELAAAARVFSVAHFKPTSAMLDRTVAQGKSFLTLIAEGADGADTANKLMAIVKRGLDARARLEAALAGQPKVGLSVLDIGAPAFDEKSK
jgi:hypothetical protein